VFVLRRRGIERGLCEPLRDSGSNRVTVDGGGLFLINILPAEVSQFSSEIRILKLHCAQN